MIGSGAKLEQGSVGQLLKKNKEESLEKAKAECVDAGWEDENEDDRKEQKVYVLDRGFVGWQERYGEDSRLTEGYRKEIWKEGYWM